ncbi:hypothetical protein FQZ97_1247170 [compost metagenome]
MARREANIWSSIAPSATSSSCPDTLVGLPELEKRGSSVRCSDLRLWLSQVVWFFWKPVQASRRTCISRAGPA